MRYFHISYAADGATGSCTMTATKFINHTEFKVMIKETRPQIINPSIMSWVEMTKEEYDIFME